MHAVLRGPKVGTHGRLINIPIDIQSQQTEERTIGRMEDDDCTTDSATQRDKRKTRRVFSFLLVEE